jgi:hypothetical protein
VTVTDWITAVATAFIAVFTVVLACVGRRQMLDTRIWGRAKFKDGFSSGRWINFCHRYPWAKSKVARDGSVTISKRWARYHHAGNKADERVPAWRKACFAAISDD